MGVGTVVTAAVVVGAGAPEVAVVAGAVDVLVALAVALV